MLSDRYCLERRIAAGGIGQVWLAYDEVLERQVAVKLLRPEYAEHPETLERFRTEARNAGALNHPNVAQVYDYGHSGLSGGPYLVMEYVDGPSLADLIEGLPLPADFTCDVIAQAASGLDAAHKAGLVHRDIKPGNMLLTAEGRVKVTDFGIAHAAGSAPITAPGTVMGTSLYMAPERIAGEPATPASDLYSLGIVMWECLAGRPPFSGSSADVMAAHLHRAMPPLPGGVPGPLRDLVARLTAKDPGHRAWDAGLLADHARTLQQVGAASGPADSDPAPRAPGDGDRRRRATVGLAVVAAAGLATALAAATGLFSGAPAAGPVASASSARPQRAASGPLAVTVPVPASLVGQQFSPVSRWLRAHGLNYRVDYAAGTGQPPGTVVSVAPGSSVRPGTTIVVTVALGGAAAVKPRAGRASGRATSSQPAGGRSAGTAWPTAGATPSPGTSGNSSPSPSLTSSPTSGPSCLAGIVCL